MTVPRPLPLSRRRALLEAGRVRVWTVQDAGAVRRARASGRLSGGWGRCPWPEDDVAGRRAYAWMRARMAERVPGFSGAWPVWVWAKRPSWRRPRPGHVLLSAVVPAARVLWSDYGLWHGPLNGGPLVADEAAWDAWEAGGACPAAAERTWDVCLDILGGGSGSWSRASGVVQGCCDGLSWAEVRHVARAGAELVAGESMEGADGA
jgi:hypothetical protein